MSRKLSFGQAIWSDERLCRPFERSGKAAADRGEKKLVGAIDDLLDRPRACEHGSCLAQELIAARQMGQVEGAQDFTGAIAGADEQILQSGKLGPLQGRSDGKRNPFGIEMS